MEINRPLTWILFGVCGGLAVPHRLWLALGAFYRRHASWRDAPAAFAEACVDALLTGLALGLGVATLVLLLAMLSARVS